MTTTHRTASAPDATTGGEPRALPRAWRHDWITYTMRRLEPWIAGSIALYTAWIAAAVLPASPTPWLFVAYAALIGWWCQRRPAHHHAAMFMRALALVAGAFVLQRHVDAGAEGPGDLFFFWLSITTLYYAFMLRPAWAVALVLGAMGAQVASVLGSGVPLWPMLAAPLGFLAIFPLGVAMRFGVAMRRSDEAMERRHRDASTGLYNLEGLLAQGGHVLQACADERKPACMVVFDCTDLQEVHTIYGRQISRRIMGRLVRKLGAIAGDHGVAARTAPTEFCLLLPGLTRDKAQGAIDRVLGRPGCIEYDAGDSEIVMVPNFTVQELDCVPQALQQAYLQQRAALVQRLQDQAEHERYLRLERERHSRPTPLVSLPVVPVTMPTPLAPAMPLR